MIEAWKERWNERYSVDEYVFGEYPNEYLKTELEKIPPGTILFPAEGEGRNAVFAAKLGWTVSAFDISTEGKRKADLLANANNVKIDYQVGELQNLNYQPGQFDVIALIYAHFPASIKSEIHKSLLNYLRKDGIIIFEAFSKGHLEYISKNPKVGGPTDPDMLFSIAEVKADFVNFDILDFEEKEIELNEGTFHKGKGLVIRFTGRKKI